MDTPLTAIQRFRFICTDKLTGRTHSLAAEGSGEDDAASKLWEIGFLISSSKPDPWKPDDTLEWLVDPSSWDIIRDKSKRRKVGKVYRAFDSNDPKEMIRSANIECHQIDRHWLLWSLSEQCFRERNRNPEYGKIVESICWQWVVERDPLSKAYAVQYDHANGPEYDIATPYPMNRLRIDLASNGNYERAVEVCELMLSLPVKIDFPVSIQNHAEKYRKKIESL